MAFYLQIDGVDDHIKVPFPVGTKYIKLRMKRYSADTAGYVFDMRTAVTVYLVNNSTAGYNSFKVDGVSKSIGSGNFTDIPTTQPADIEIGLTTATTVADMLTLFARYSIGTNASERLQADIHDIVLYDTSMNVLQAFTWSGSGQTLTSTTGAGNGTITGGTWLDDGAGGGTNVTVTSVTANASASSIVPTVTAQKQVSVSSAVANAIAEALAPSVGSNTNITVTAVIANVTASANAPNVEAIRNINIAHIIPNMVSTAIIPTIRIVEPVIFRVKVPVTSDIENTLVFKSEIESTMPVSSNIISMITIKSNV